MITVTPRHEIRRIAEIPTIDSTTLAIEAEDWAGEALDGQHRAEQNIIIADIAVDSNHIPAIIEALCEAKKVLDAAREAAQ